MSKHLHPETRVIGGPFILNDTLLISLQKALDEIILRLNSDLDEKLNSVAKKLSNNRLEEGGNKKSEKKARKIVSNKLKYQKKETLTILTASNNMRLADSNLENILKDPALLHYSPEILEIKIIRGTSVFDMTIRSGREKECEVSVWCENPSTSAEIWHIFNNWLSESKPPIIIKSLNYLAHIIMFLVGLFVFVGLIDDFSPQTKTIEAAYIENSNPELIKLLDGGIDQSELARITEIAIRREFAIIPEDFNPTLTSITPGLSKSTIFLVLGFLFSITIPKTTIGIGRKKWVGLLYTYWTRLVIVIFPTSLIIPWLFEKFLI